MTQAKYLEIANILTNRIRGGQYKARQPLPDQQALANELGVSRLTVKKALDGMQREGLVYKQSGLGTFVSGPVPIKETNDYPVNQFSGLKASMPSQSIQTEVLHFNEELPDENLQKYLSLKKKQPIYDILRLRKRNNQPYILEHDFLPVKLVPGLNKQVLKDSLYTYIHQTLKLTFGSAYRKIRACKSTKNDQRYLNAEFDDPILEMQQLAWLTTGVPIEYSFSRSRFDQRNFSMVENNRF